MIAEAPLDLDTSAPDREVPGILDRWGKPLRIPADHDAWERSWYPEVMLHRVRVAIATGGESTTPDAAEQQARDAQKELLLALSGADRTLYWMCTFGWILEPRDSKIPRRPYLPYPRQVQLLDVYDEVMATPWPHPRASLFIPKTRDAGVTWIDATDNVVKWSFEDSWWALIISMNEELAKKKSNTKSYMFKVDYLLKNQPAWLLPDGFSGFGKRSEHRNEEVGLLHPTTGSAINSSATTDDAGRGDRKSKVTVDEAPTIDNLGAVWDLLNSVTWHRFGIGTANMDHGPDAYDIVHGKNGQSAPRLFYFRWHHVPGRDQRWLKGMRDTMSEDGFAREIMIDWKAGTGDLVYPRAGTKRPGHFPAEPGKQNLVGIDDGWDDHFAIVWIQLDLRRKKYHVVAAYWSQHHAIKRYGYLMTGSPSTEFKWNREELRMMQLIRDTGLLKATYYGDRHGDNTDLSSGVSPFQVLSDEFGINVITATDPDRNDLKFRRDAFNEILDDFEWNDDYGAPESLEAVQNSRFPKPRGNTQATSETRKPIHNASSHFRSIFEIISVNRRAHWMHDRPRGPLPRATTGRQPGLGQGRRWGVREANGLIVPESVNTYGR